MVGIMTYLPWQLLSVGDKVCLHLGAPKQNKHLCFLLGEGWRWVKQVKTAGRNLPPFLSDLLSIFSPLVLQKKKKKSEVTQSCPTLCDPMDCRRLGSSIHRIFQARILEWIAISFSKGSSPPRDWTQVSCIPGRLWGGSDSKDPGSIPGSGRSLGQRNGNPLQYSCLENPMNGGAWMATVHGVAKTWVINFKKASLSSARR